MTFITAKFRALPQHAGHWPDTARDFTEATRAEPGCLWFDWSRSIDDPTEYVLVEAFRDDEAGAAHVGSEHFDAAQRELPPHLAETPLIINANIDQEGQNWARCASSRQVPKAGAERPRPHLPW